MALVAGQLELVVEYAHGLKDTELLGRQDPYCLIECGNSSTRTRTATDGGTKPVWNETFAFNIVHENELVLTIKNENAMKDDMIGRARVDLMQVRQQGMANMKVPVHTAKGAHKGEINLILRFKSGGAPGGMLPGGYQQPMGYAPPPMGYAPPPMGYNQQPMGYGQQPMYPQQQQYGQPMPGQQPMYPQQQQYGQPMPYGYAPPAYPQQGPPGRGV